MKSALTFLSAWQTLDRLLSDSRPLCLLLLKSVYFGKVVISDSFSAPLDVFVSQPLTSFTTQDGSSLDMQSSRMTAPLTFVVSMTQQMYQVIKSYVVHMKLV